MKTKTLFFSSLLAAAAMSTVPAFADYTWNATSAGTSITQELWQNQNSWTLSGGSSWKTSGTGPGTSSSEMWDKIVIDGSSGNKISGSISSLEGWALKLDLKNASLTVGQLSKLQSNNNCSISLDKDSVLTVSRFAGGNDGGDTTLTNEGTFNLTMGKAQGGGSFLANLGSTGVFNISGGYSAKIGTLSAKLGNGSSDFLFTISGGNTVYTRNLVNLTNTTLQNTATYSFTDKDGSALTAVSSLSELTGTDKYFAVKDSSGYRVSYLVSGISDQVYSWNASALSSWSDAVWKKGETTSQTITTDGTAYLGAESTSTAITIGSATTVNRLIVDSDYTLSGDGSLTMTNGGIVNSGKTLTLTKKTNATGFLRGAIEVAGTLQFNDGDITGYNGGENSLQKITVDAGGILKLNHSNNETFAGTLILNGTLSGKDANTRWDIYNNNSKINVGENANAVIDENIKVVIRRNDAPIDVATGANLTIKGQVLKSSEVGQQLGGNGVLKKTGNGVLTLEGAVKISSLNTENGETHLTGTTEKKIDNSIYAKGASVIIGDGSAATVVSAGRVEMGDSQGGSSNLEVKQNATLAITGNDNGTSYKNASLVLSEWENSTTATISGTLLAKDAKVLRGDHAATLNVSGGTLAVKGFYATKNAGNAVTVNVSDSGKLILGSGDVSGINQVNVSLNNGTLAASESAIAFSKNIALNGAGTIDTTQYNFASDGKSISRGATGAAITLAGVISGSGALNVTGAGMLTLSGENTLTGNVSVSSGTTLVANHASALGTGTVSVAENAKLGLVAGTTVSGVTGGIELASGAKLVVDMTSKASATETFTLDLITGTALKYNGTSVSSSNVGTLLGSAYELSNWNKTGWISTLSYANNKLSLTMSIPEPSSFGLLAGLGALALVGARRRRKTK